MFFFSFLLICQRIGSGSTPLFPHISCLKFFLFPSFPLLAYDLSCFSNCLNSFFPLISGLYYSFCHSAIPWYANISHLANAIYLPANCISNVMIVHIPLNLAAICRSLLFVKVYSPLIINLYFTSYIHA